MNKLITKAIEAKENSYSPYSNFKVGAAVLTENGEIFTGSNIENAAYSETICGERVAIFKAISSGAKSIVKIAVFGDSDYTFPCGACRQVMSEFAKNLEIIVGINELDYKVYKIEELLPHSFSKEDLK